jgi:PTH1 family peptidyl-tRNA hydrolase
MNESGRSVGEAMRFYKLDLPDVVVFHDELDLAPGKLRVKRGGGAAGHNGLRSIDAHVGNDYWRVRIGIGHPGHPDRVTGYVLSDFAADETGWVKPMLDALAQAAPLLASGADAKFLSKVALLTQPPRPPAPPKTDRRETSPADTAGPES